MIQFFDLNLLFAGIHIHLQIVGASSGTSVDRKNILNPITIINIL